MRNALIFQPNEKLYETIERCVAIYMSDNGKITKTTRKRVPATLCKILKLFRRVEF
jgi:hypothetical protein